MISLLFVLCMLVVFGKIASLALQAAWGITKVLLTIVFLPVILVALALSGLMAIAFPVLICIGLIALFVPAFV